jgi:hypothetical protein
LANIVTDRLAKNLDLITATLRQHAWRLLAARGCDAVEREALSRLVTMHGVGQVTERLATTIGAADLERIGSATMARCTAELPHVPIADIAALVRDGIAGGQGRYQNNDVEVLGYSGLDGFPIPPGQMLLRSLPRATLSRIVTVAYRAACPANSIAVWAWWSVDGQGMVSRRGGHARRLRRELRDHARRARCRRRG